MSGQGVESTAAGPGPSAGRDWTDTVTDRVTSIVGTVRDKTTVPITKVARTVVYGVVIAVGALLALLLVVIALLRVLDVYLPFDPYGRRVWVVDAGLGAIFVIVGLFLWSKRTAK